MCAQPNDVGRLLCAGARQGVIGVAAVAADAPHAISTAPCVGSRTVRRSTWRFNPGSAAAAEARVAPRAAACSESATLESAMQSARTAARGWGGATVLPARARGADEGNERGRTRQSRTRSHTTQCHARTASGRPGLLQPQSLLRPGRRQLRLNGTPHCPPTPYTPIPKSPGHAGWGELAVLIPQFPRARHHSHPVAASTDHRDAGF